MSFNRDQLPDDITMLKDMLMSQQALHHHYRAMYILRAAEVDQAVEAVERATELLKDVRSSAVNIGNLLLDLNKAVRS